MAAAFDQCGGDFGLGAPVLAHEFEPGFFLIGLRLYQHSVAVFERATDCVRIAAGQKSGTCCGTVGTSARSELPPELPPDYAVLDGIMQNERRPVIFFRLEFPILTAQDRATLNGHPRRFSRPVP